MYVRSSLRRPLAEDLILHNEKHGVNRLSALSGDIVSDRATLNHTKATHRHFDPTSPRCPDEFAPDHLYFNWYPFSTSSSVLSLWVTEGPLWLTLTNFMVSSAVLAGMPSAPSMSPMARAAG